LCEDAQARIFADAKNWFYRAAGVKEEPQSEDLPQRLQQDFKKFSPTFFTPTSSGMDDIPSLPWVET
jgi:hypothetical protein